MSMVQRRFFFLMVLVLVGFSLFYAAGLWEQDKYDKERQERFERRLFPSLEEETLESLSFENEQGSVTVTRSTDGSGVGTWKITAPLDLGTDGPVVEGILRYLKRAERTGEVGVKRVDTGGGETVIPPKDLGLFGLDSPRSRLTVNTTGGAETLLLGNTNAFNGQLFVQKLGEPGVMSAASDLQYLVNKSLFDLRDKRLTTFDPGDVETLRVEYDGVLRYQVERRGAKGEFHLVKPEERFASQGQVGGVLAVLGNLNARAFVVENAGEGELKTFGLDSPWLRVTLTKKSGPGHVFLFSKEQSEGKAAGFVTMEGGGPIIKVVPAGIYPRIALPLKALFDNHVLRFNREEVVRITLNSESGRMELRRVEEEGRENWRLMAPVERDIRDSQVKGIFFLLETMETGLVSDEVGEGNGLDDALLTARGLGAKASEIKLWGESGELLAELRLGVRVGDQRFVQKTVGSSILVVEGERLEGLPFDIEALKDAAAELN